MPCQVSSCERGQTFAGAAIKVIEVVLEGLLLQQGVFRLFLDLPLLQRGDGADGGGRILGGRPGFAARPAGILRLLARLLALLAPAAQFPERLPPGTDRLDGDAPATDVSNSIVWKWCVPCFVRSHL